MVRAVFATQGPLATSQEGALVGLNDLHLVETTNGTMLYAATRGGGWISAFDVGGAAGQTTAQGNWQIASQYLQLETTDLVVRDTGTGSQLYMAGLNSSSLRGVGINGDGQGSTFQGNFAATAGNQDLSTFTEMELLSGSQNGLAAIRGGGLVNVSFGADNNLNVSTISQGQGMQSARADDIITATHNGQSYAFVSYGNVDTVSMFRQRADGRMEHVSDVDAGNGLWVDRPGAIAVATAADGGLYVVVAASGSDSLSVLAVAEDGSGMVPVDHIIDGLDTRFANASHVTSVNISGQDYVLAAGSDSGISLFIMLPGGRLQHVETMAGSINAPLRGITSVEAMAVPGGIRIWVATESAPFLSEFSVSLQNVGVSLAAAVGGGTLNGTDNDDVLGGGVGNDQLNGGNGNDILIDGAGQDTLRGGSGADLFIFTRDGVRDVILDYQTGIDQIDLSGFGQIGGAFGLTVTSRTWGAELRFGNEIIEVRSANGTSLSASDFGPDSVIIGGRVVTDPELYPDPDGGADPDPTPDPPLPPGQHAPTQLAGTPPDHPEWQGEPTYSIVGMSGNVRGNAEANFIRTTGADDCIFGNFGDDTIQSADGNDSVSGDGGNDDIHGGGGDDLLLGGLGFDTIFGGDGDDTIVGGGHADSLSGGNGNDVIVGGDGYDQINGGEGNDTIWAGATADRVYGGDGHDWISAGSNFGYTVDGIWGEGGNDTIFGDAGFDYLNGGDGDDVLDGGYQADNLYGEAGNDILLGGQGLDRLFGGSGDDQCYGGEGNDGHFGEAGNDTLWGGSGNDRFFGGIGNDIVDGGTENDTIYAGAGFDTLIGGAGDDLLFGNFNADRFVFADNHGNDTISDFDASSTFELLDFTNLTGFENINDVLSAATQTGRDILIETGANNSIRLIGVSLADLDESDFLF
ncbi:MAG: hypothetical protein WA790_03705 [Sulfitobacter sp.]